MYCEWVSRLSFTVASGAPPRLTILKLVEIFVIRWILTSSTGFLFMFLNLHFAFKYFTYEGLISRNG